MPETEMTRSRFLRGGSCLAAGALLGGATAGGSESRREGQAQESGAGQQGSGGAWGGIVLRPYQLLCIFCAFGENESGPKDERLKRAVEAIRSDPDLPLTLRSNAGDVYVYQDPGTQLDTPEGSDFNRKRDLDVLERMNWAPGTTLPARTMLLCLLKRITTVSGLCGYDTVTSDAWKGCPKARSGNYEKGRQRGIEAVIPPRSEQEMAREKERSLAALYSAKAVTIRPHILLCAVCQYGGGTRPPFKADNLPELLDLILHKNPDLLITMARGADWMMCAPCPARASKRNACVNVLGSGGLSNEKRDLDMLQKLGLCFGSTMKAGDLFRLIFAKIPTTRDICKRDHPCPSVWWDPCGEDNRTKGNPNYEKGRQELMEKLARAPAPQGSR